MLIPLKSGRTVFCPTAFLYVCSIMRKGLLLFAFLLALTACSSDQEPQQLPTSLDDLAGKRVAYLTGSIYDLRFDEILPNSIRVGLNGIPEIMMAVKQGQADYSITDSVSYIGVDLAQHDCQFCFADDIISGDAGVCFRKDNTELCGKFNEFLAGIKADGTFEYMKDRWLTQKIDTAQIPHYSVSSDARVLKIGIINSYPFEFIKDGEWQGFEIEMMVRFAHHMGMKPEFVCFEFNTMLPSIMTGRVDAGLCFIFITEERAKQVLFSDPYMSCGTLVVGPLSGADRKQSKGLVSVVKDSFKNNLIVEDRWKLIVDGLYETLIITIFSILLGTVLGCLICWMRLSRRRLLSGIAKVYVEILRDIPMLVFLMIMFYVVFSSSRITSTWVAIIAFAMNFGAYTSEMFRTGIQGVDPGQTEAGLALGFTRTGTFLNFVAPQAIRTVIPVFKGEAISLLKNTSIVGYIAIQDLTRVSDMIRSRTFDAFFPLLVVTIIYFILAWLIGLGLDALNRKEK